jgi:hypothetical protein
MFAIKSPFQIYSSLMIDALTLVVGGWLGAHKHVDLPLPAKSKSLITRCRRFSASGIWGQN